MSSESLDGFLARGRAQVDAALERYLPAPPSCPAIVSEAMRYSVFAGGKRFRPMLTLAAAEAIDRSAEALRHRDSQALNHNSSEVAQGFREVAQGFSPALPAACAIEMIHTYSLIHDDLPAMDDDTLRRGRATLHVVYGDGIAILAGDGLHAEAFSLLAREPVTDDPALVARKLRVVQVIAEAAGPTGMVGGQAIDLQAGGQVPGHPVTLDADGLRAMHARKTGALIRASAVSGAILAGASDPIIAAVDRYASEVGLAFQIVDDILDVEGDQESLGKTAGKDAAGDKPTYPAVFGLDRSKALAAESLDRALQALSDLHLSDSHLAAIARWVVTRKS